MWKGNKVDKLLACQLEKVKNLILYFMPVQQRLAQSMDDNLTKSESAQF